MTDRDEGFAAYFASRSSVMRGTAFLLCGDWHRAEDLVQTAFVKLYRSWHRITEYQRLDAYTRQILVRTFLDETRRGFRYRESPTPDHADHAGPAAGDGVEDRLVLVRALADLPARQRATLVLRFWADLSVEDTAKVLRCSVGTVKSQTSRGLDAMRDLVPTPF